MDTNSKFMPDKIYFRCISLAYLAIAAKVLDFYTSEFWIMIIYQKFIDLQTSSSKHSSSSWKFLTKRMKKWDYFFLLCLFLNTWGKKKYAHINLMPPAEFG